LSLGGRGGLLALSALCALGFPNVALAQAELRVHVEVRDCGELSQPEIRRVLAAELNAQLAEEHSPDVTRIVIECRGARTVLRVGDPLTRKVVQRTIDLGSSDPPARGRLVALATAELVLASWTELESNPTPKVEPAGPPPPPAARAAARQVARRRTSAPPNAPAAPPLPRNEVPPPAPRRPPGSEPPYDERWPDPQDWGIDDPSPDRGFRVVGLISARAFFAYEGILWGGGLRVGEERFKTVGWTLDALAESGEIDASGTDLRVDTATIGGGMNLYARSPAVIGRIGVGIRMGFARTQVDTLEAANASFAPWGWPLGSLGLTLRARRTVIELSGEGSYVALPVAPGASVQGGWFGIQVGIGVLP
jgi:hypothetical protein